MSLYPQDLAIFCVLKKAPRIQLNATQIEKASLTVRDGIVLVDYNERRAPSAKSFVANFDLSAFLQVIKAIFLIRDNFPYKGNGSKETKCLCCSESFRHHICILPETTQCEIFKSGAIQVLHF